MDQPNSADRQDEADWKDEPAGRATPPPQPGILQRYVAALGRGGSRTGGVVGGIAGGVALGPAGVGPGAFVGNLMGQSPPLSPAEQGAIPQPLAQKHPTGVPFPEGYAKARAQQGGIAEDHPEYRPDYEAAAADAATQGTFSALLRGAGGIAARFGHPRLAGVLGARPPVEAVEAATPAAVKGVSTPALQGVDAASLAGNPAAKEIAAISAEQARRDAVLALERQTSERTMAPIQSRMAARDTAELLPKTQAFSKSLDAANIPDNARRAAFADAPSIEEAATNPGVRAARQDLVTSAVPQSVDSKALKLAARPIAAAEARGVSGPPTQAAADAAGLRELGGNLPADNSYLTRVVNRVPGVGSAMQILPQGGMSPDRVAQSTAAVLASRGSPTINPELAKILAGGATYRASPVAQADTELLRKYLSQNR